MIYATVYLNNSNTPCVHVNLQGSEALEFDSVESAIYFAKSLVRFGKARIMQVFIEGFNSKGERED